jgi:hypothetical protein
MTREVGFHEAADEDPITTDTSWDGILDVRERIIWQGRPDAAISLRLQNYMLAGFGFVFAGFALFWMIVAAGDGGFLWMFGLIHFAVGVGIIFGAIYKSSYVRKRTWYTLTNKRAFIATVLPIRGKRLKSYPVTPETQLDFHDETPASIYFSEDTRRKKNGTYTVNIGFERIGDGREVYKKLRKIQGGRV